MQTADCNLAEVMTWLEIRSMSAMPCTLGANAEGTGLVCSKV